MSWDLFLQQLPAGITSIEDIPDDFRPGPIGTRREVEQLFRESFPGVTFDEPGFWNFRCDDGSIQMFLDESDPIGSIMLACRGGPGICRYIEALAQRWGHPIIDVQPKGGLLFPGQSCEESLERWSDYRDLVVADADVRRSGCGLVRRLRSIFRRGIR
ncbi:MAG: hypothetical protein ACF8R7_16400 [Phycisphaerales bacterium JB039]